RITRACMAMSGIMQEEANAVQWTSFRRCHPGAVWRNIRKPARGTRSVEGPQRSWLWYVATAFLCSQGAPQPRNIPMLSDLMGDHWISDGASSSHYDVLMLPNV